mmetsp:Transcript_15787/g.29787  ORF Transcript_15787/g.29787 Transcript_15787/m.29787 type:complete len:227 (+) Transcript_15787:71-751(+)|eukprot:CAMPEP_0176500740 /NCGR_PEP_ID=MMETSP0200_2-20121128/13753_1 /TAXON_ID=947934 /ORGANISM="Chaetoceros sp., Strain GSL56" /LENGTH=226 /DNA_ID=CAMNT_0017899509 /DNA_START=28 /DNA_END=708 /DNA_ORIENTATION=+
MPRVFNVSSFIFASYLVTLSSSFAATRSRLKYALSTSPSNKGYFFQSTYGSFALLKGSTADNDNNYSDRSDDVKSAGIPSLPPIGQSSFTGETSSKKSGTIRLDGTSQAVGNVGSDKFELQYTCKVCETRNSHKVSRLAYRQGVVITVCKGCMNKHLIADNLGWMQYVGGFDGNSNIEDYMNDIGRGDEVNRVSQEVFELEKLVHSDADDNLSSSSLDETENNSFE